jgi:hypothetical protein
MTMIASSNQGESLSTNVAVTDSIIDADIGTVRRSTRAKRVIFVVGMHRSGTSALTRTLSLVGASLPKTLLPENYDNPTGFWESSELVALHDDILASAGSRWDDLGNIPECWFASEDAVEFRIRAHTLLASEFPKASLPIIKDPRVCRLVPFWVATLAEVNAVPLFIFALRNPMEIAASLASRNGFPLAKTLLLWLKHNLEAERHTRGLPRSFVLYDNLMLDWRREIVRVGQELELGWPRRSFHVDAEIDSFLSPRLRHHAVGVEAFERQSQIPVWAKEAYRALLAAVSGGEADTAALDRIARELLNADVAFGPLVASLERELSSASSTVNTLHDEITRGNNETARLTGAVSSAEQVVTSLQQQLQDSSLRVSELESGLHEHQEQVVELERIKAEREAEAAGLRNALADRDNSLDASKSIISEREAQMEALQQSIADRDRKIAEACSGMDQQAADLQAVKTSLAAQNNEISTLQRSLQNRERELVDLGRSHEDLGAALNEMRATADERAATISRLRQTLAQADDEREGLRKSLAEVFRVTGDRERRIDELEVRYGEQRDQAFELRSALADTGRERDRLSDLLSRKEGEYAKLKAHLDEAVRHAERQGADLQRINCAFGEQTAQLTALTVQAATADAERHHLRQAVGQRDACIDDLTGRLSSVDDRLQALLQDLDQQIDETQVLKRELGEREQRINGLEGQLGVHREEVHTLRDALTRIEFERDRLCDFGNRKEAEVADLSSRLNEAVQRSAIREDELLTANLALSDRTSKLEAVSELVRRLEEDRNQLQAAVMARDAHVGELMAKLLAADSHLEMLFDNLDNQGSEIQQLDQQLEARSVELRRLGATTENYARNLHALIVSALEQGIYLKPQNFDETEYLALNPDVKDAIEQGLFASGYEHWLLFGGYEQRQVTFQQCDSSPNLSKKGKISILDRTRGNSKSALLNRLRRMVRPLKLAFSSQS